MSSQEFYQYVMHDVLNGIQGISSRKMFGGYGLYKYGVMFGLISDDVLYFKVDDTNKKEYEKRNSKPFMYFKKNKSVILSYWEVPSEILENKEKLTKWIDLSCTIQLKKKRKQ